MCLFPQSSTQLDDFRFLGLELILESFPNHLMERRSLSHYPLSYSTSFSFTPYTKFITTYQSTCFCLLPLLECKQQESGD